MCPPKHITHISRHRKKTVYLYLISWKWPWNTVLHSIKYTNKLGTINAGMDLKQKEPSLLLRLLYSSINMKNRMDIYTYIYIIKISHMTEWFTSWHLAKHKKLNIYIHSYLHWNVIIIVIPRKNPNARKDYYAHKNTFNYNKR